MGLGWYLSSKAALNKLKDVRHIIPGTWQELGKPRLLESSDGSQMLSPLMNQSEDPVKDVSFIDVAILTFIIIHSRSSQPFKL